MHATGKPIVGRVPSTLKEAYRDYCQTVARWAWHLGGPDVEVEDAVQEIFFVVSRQMANFRGDAHFSSWLYGITRKIVANHRRRHRWRFWRDKNRDILDRLPSPGLDPYAQLERQQARLQFYRVLDLLPEKYRTVLVLFELEDMSTLEIAEICQLKLNTVKVQLHRAREMFHDRHRQLLTEEKS
jgi:RNA polymerase sigma-70 factor (ECF subfamily)